MRRRAPNTEVIEEKCRRLRLRLGVDALLSPHVPTVLEKASDVFPGLKVQLVADADLPHAEAEADCETKVIRVRDSIYSRCKDGDGRARMTLIHELAHIALGHSAVRCRRSQLDTSLAKNPREDREEYEARLFAALFLVPTYLGRQVSSVEELVEKFGISRHAAEVRFSQLALYRMRSSRGPVPRNPNGEPASEPRTKNGERQLPPKVVSFLREAERRGHPVTSLAGIDEKEK